MDARRRTLGARQGAQEGEGEDDSEKVLLLHPTVTESRRFDKGMITHTDTPPYTRYADNGEYLDGEGVERPRVSRLNARLKSTFEAFSSRHGEARGRADRL